MSIVELMQKAKKSASERTRQDRKTLLIDAHILDTNGNYDSVYFSKSTVQRSKAIKRTA
jgi:hypothetical protein